MQNYAFIIAQELNIRPQQTEAVIRLLDEDATVPFIARYRKEATGSLDEVAVTAIRDRLAALKELDKRREAILASLEERGLLTPELRAKIEAADALTVLEDIYLPYRPKRRTRASMAKERGLEPLADQLARQDRTLPEVMAAAYVDAEKGVPDAEAALAGARDILAERFAEDQPARERLRKLFGREGLMRSKAVSGKEEDPDAAKYRDYFAWDEPAAQAPSHRILAMFRGEEEGFLRLSLRPRNEEQAQDLLARLFVRNDGPCGREVRAAALDGYGRLFYNEIERFVAVNRDDDRKNLSRLVLRTCIELLAEVHDIDSLRTQCGTNRGRRIGGTTFDLQFNKCSNLFCHSFPWLIILFLLE